MATLAMPERRGVNNSVVKVVPDTLYIYMSKDSFDDHFQILSKYV